MPEEHYWRNETDGQSYPTWQQTPRAVPPPLGRPSPPTQGSAPGRTPSAPTPPGPAASGPAGGGTWGAPPLPPRQSPSSWAGHQQAQQVWTPAAPGPPRAPWMKRHRVQLVAALGLVIAVIAGVGVWRTTSQNGPQPNRLPFYLAVTSLLTEPVAHYSGSAEGGAARWDLEATNGGETLGTVTVAGQQISVMTVGGKTYVKPTPQMLAGLPAGVSASSVQGKWVTGDDSLSNLLPQALASPSVLGTALWKELGTATDFPKTGARTIPIGSDPALEVTTADGALYVSATAPYRVLRWVPKNPTGTGTRATGASLTARHQGPAVAAAWVRQTVSGDNASAGSEALPETDFPPVSSAEVDQTYGDLIAQTKTLTSAIDLGISFDFNQTGNLDCSDDSCTVTENVVTSTTSTSSATLSGTATAVMTATVTVDGQAAGGCTQTQTLSVNGSGTMSCPDPEVAPVIQQIKAEKQAQADEQAEATGQDVDIPYTLAFEADVQIEAMADVQAKVDQDVSSEEAAQRAADQDAADGASCTQNSFVAGTRVLMANGTTEPIQDVKVGDTIENAVPGSGSVARHTVVATHITDTDRDFVVLTIATPGGIGEIRSTVHHLFYDATTATWSTAAALKPGDRLQTTGSTVATVRTVQTYTAADRTYNLTIDDVHTYYVLAGETPVLVHNDGDADDDYNQAMNKALAWLVQRGFNAERPTIGKFGTIQGSPIGMQTADGKTGFRIEFDGRNGAHINVWSGKEKGPHFNFNASESTVTKIQGQFGC